MWKKIYKKIFNKVLTPIKFPIKQNLSSNKAKLLISHSLKENIRVMKQLFAKTADIVYRNLVIGEEGSAASIIFIDGIAEENTINEFVIKSLTKINKADLMNLKADSILDLVKKYFIEVSDITEVSTIGEVTNLILEGNTVLFIDDINIALNINTKGLKSRSISEPITEKVVRGPRDGFTEVIRTNTALLRHRIKSHKLKMEKFILGRATKTEINVVYLEDIADKNVIKEVKARISRIDVDSILESGYVEELIEDEPFTLFPQIEHSERPDKVAASILEGRIAIFVDGTPFVLIVPTIFIQFMQSSEDYYQRYPFTVAIRTVRYLFFILALLLPSSYIAVVSFHQEFIPTSLLISIMAAHVSVPFPPFVEAILMEITFEALREAGIRLPTPVGQAVSIVGALVIGQAAVMAGIFSPVMVIVVSLTAIASFAIPAYDMAYAVRVLRFGFMLLAATLGFYGILLGLLTLVLHLASLRSFGVPFLSPIAPLKLKDLKDVVVRFPWWAMKQRPSLIGGNNRQRQKFFLKPHPPKNE